MRASEHKTAFQFTGYHMVGVMVAFFGTIISVNLLMAYYATSTWSGLVVPNSYVASQEFNGKVAALQKMMATGIRGELSIVNGQIRYRLTWPEEKPVAADEVTAAFKRPVSEDQDFTVRLQPVGNGTYMLKQPVEPGHWIVELKASSGGQLIMHEAVRIDAQGEAR